MRLQAGTLQTRAHVHAIILLQHLEQEHHPSNKRITVLQFPTLINRALNHCFFLIKCFFPDSCLVACHMTVFVQAVCTGRQIEVLDFTLFRIEQAVPLCIGLNNVY